MLLYDLYSLDLVVSCLDFVPCPDYLSSNSDISERPTDYVGLSHFPEFLSLLYDTTTFLRILSWI